MKIRYLVDGVSQMSEDTEVVAQSNSFFFILKSSHLLYGISKKHVPVKVYANSKDEPPYVIEYIKLRNDEDPIDEPALDMEYHLPTMDNAN